MRSLRSRRISHRSLALAAGVLVTAAPGVARAVEYPCSVAGLDAALANGGDATFDCATATTLPLSTGRTIAISGTKLDGGGKVTLSGMDAATTLTVPAGVSATVTNMTLTNGKATYYGSNLVVGGTLAISNSTVKSGTDGVGGAIFVAGGGVLDMNACTVSNNITGAEGALAVHGTATLVNSTVEASHRGIVTRNGGSAAARYSTIIAGTGEPVFAIAAGDTITVGHSIVLSAGGAVLLGGSGSFVSEGYNLFNKTGVLTGVATGNQFGVTPLLQDLADNGGPTQTRAFAVCSPGINAGATTAGGVTVDQRGQPRNQNGALDIGAYESSLRPCLSIDPATTVEGNAGTSTLTFPVRLSGRSTLAVSTSYASANGSATTTDYAATSGVLNFAAGETSSSIFVTVTGDTTYETNEYMLMSLSAPSNATIATGSVQGTITNDDAAPTLSIADVSVTEGTGGATVANVTVSLDRASYQTITVNYATANGTATAGADFTAASGVLTFAPGVVTTTIPITITSDALAEGNETFTLGLSAPTNASIADGSGQITITDDEGSAGLSIGSASTVEGNAGTTDVSLTVTLSPPSASTVTVDWATANGTATTADGDFTAGSGQLTFTPGQTSQTITVNVNGDLRREPNESFTVALSNATNASVVSGPGTVSITNDDEAPAVSISAPVTVIEGNAGTTTASFEVKLGAPSSETVLVSYATADGTATVADGDYVAASGNLTFLPDELTKTVSVTVNGDERFEPSETFSLTLGAPVNATVGQGTATATITNDDLEPPPDAGPDAGIGGDDAGSTDGGGDDGGGGDAGSDASTPGPDGGTPSEPGQPSPPPSGSSDAGSSINPGGNLQIPGAGGSSDDGCQVAFVGAESTSDLAALAAPLALLAAVRRRRRRSTSSR